MMQSIGVVSTPDSLLDLDQLGTKLSKLLLAFAGAVRIHTGLFVKRAIAF